MKLKKIHAFEKHLQGAAPSHFSSLYFILGKDDFERKLATDMLISALFPDPKVREMSLKVFEGANALGKDLFAELNTLPFLVGKAAVLVRDADKLDKSIQESLQNYFANPNPRVYLILSAPSILATTNYYKKGEKSGIILDIEAEKPWEKEKILTEWIQKECRKAGKTISQPCCIALQKHAGTDLAMISQEIAKLLCYIGDLPNIALSDISAICASVNQENVWQLGEAIFSQDISAALRISKALLADGSHILALLKQIRTQFQTEYQICSLLEQGRGGEEISTQFPYMRGNILEKHCMLARQYGSTRLRKGLILIEETELEAKNGSGNLDLLAELLIIRLSK